MKIKTTMKYHYIYPPEVLKWKIQKIPSIGADIKQLGFSSTGGGKNWPIHFLIQPACAAAGHTQTPRSSNSKRISCACVQKITHKTVSHSNIHRSSKVETVQMCIRRRSDIEMGRQSYSGMSCHSENEPIPDTFHDMDKCHNITLSERIKTQKNTVPIKDRHN